MAGNPIVHPFSTDNHKLESWEYADAAALAAATGFTADDLGRIAYQVDTKAYYRLDAVTPSITWTQTNSAGVPSSRAIATNAGLIGGGDFTTNRTHGMHGFAGATVGYIPTKSSTANQLTWIDPASLGGGGGGGAGIGAWSSATAYGANAWVFGSDGNMYYSVASTTNNDPITDDGTYWGLLRVQVNTTLAVASGGRFTSLGPALAFCKNAAINDGVLLTITIANGTYNEAAQFYWTHPYGERISIIGDITNGANVVLYCNNHTNAFIVDKGAVLGYIDGMTIKGDWTGSSTLDRSLTALFAHNGSRIYCGPQMRTQDFYYGVQASRCGLVEANYIQIAGCGDVGAFAYEHGCVIANHAIVSNARDTTNGWGSGFQAETGGYIHCDSSEATTCLVAGYYCNSGKIRCYSANSHGNTGHGFYAERGGYFEANSGTTAQSNGGDGVRVYSGSGFECFDNSMLITNNTGAGIWCYGGSYVRAPYASVTNNGAYGIDVFGNATVEVDHVTFTGNGHSNTMIVQMMSFVYAFAPSGGPSYNISANSLSADGCYIRA